MILPPAELAIVESRKDRVVRHLHGARIARVEVLDDDALRGGTRSELWDLLANRWPQAGRKPGIFIPNRGTDPGCPGCKGALRVLTFGRKPELLLPGLPGWRARQAEADEVLVGAWISRHREGVALQNYINC